MAILRVPTEGLELTAPEAIAERVRPWGVEFARWAAERPLAHDAAADDVLAAYAPQLDELKRRGGYTTADVVDLKPDTPNLQAMLDRFKAEHFHDEDEVRFTLVGHGVFHLHPRGGPLASIEVGSGDLIRLPRGIWHWFDLCGDRRIRAIRLFQNKEGWTPHYTGSGVEQGAQPVCLGAPTHLAAR
ncbi:MAG: hypothetical protein K1X89_00345 [Myxococcaceae bacterium]|nr:hypothetical protein [Myxococcaceae bacterium]